MSQPLKRLAIAIATSSIVGSSACSLLSLSNLDEGGGGGATEAAGSTAATGEGTTTAGETVAATGTSATSGPIGSVAVSSGAGGEGGQVMSTTGGDGAGGAGTSTGAGGAGGEEPIITSPCESTRVLDHFERPDGPLGSDWVDVDGIAVVGARAQNTPAATGYKRARWGTDFGPEQEAHAFLAAIDPNGDEQLLLLKIQGSSNIEVLYAPAIATVEVWTCTPSCTLQDDLPMALPEGTRFAARATSDGRVLVCADGEVLLDVDVSDWDGYRGGGGIGIGTLHFDASDPPFAFDDFGGGDVGG